MSGFTPRARCAISASATNPHADRASAKYIRQPLLINQLQFSVCHALMLDQEIHFNMDTPFSPDRSREIIEYCRLKDITIQAWSPFQYGFSRVYSWITPNSRS